MASPATFLTAANERIHFTKHSSGSAFNLLQSHSQHQVWHKQCHVGRCAPGPCSRRNAAQQSSLLLESAKNHCAAAIVVCTADSLIVCTAAYGCCDASSLMVCAAT